MNEIFLDTETTGLSYRDGDKIVEIACIETKDLIPTKNIFHELINPKRNMPDEAFKIHGFTSDFLKTKKTFEEISDDFVNFIQNKKIIIHNASFDLGFLNHELKLIKKNEIKKENIIDTLVLAREKNPGTSNSLDALCRKFSIDLSRRKKHNALLDCELLREVYINLLDVREPKLNFTKSDENTNSVTNLDIKKIYYKKIINPTEKELDKHKNFLKTEIKKNYF